MKCDLLKYSANITWKGLMGIFLIVVSQPSDVRSKIKEYHTNQNLISFRVMFLGFFFGFPLQ